MDTMLRFLARSHVALALLAGSLSAACADGEKDPPVEEAPGLSTGSTCPSSSTLTYENFGASFFESYCTRCHSENPSDGSRHGAPVGLNWDDLDTVREHAARIDRLAAMGPDATNTAMPPSAPRPTLGERNDLGEWLACGAP
jgi:uncharacterized membrane protein